MKGVEVRKLIDWLNYLFTKRGQGLLSDLSEIERGKIGKRITPDAGEHLSHIAQMALIEGIITKKEHEGLTQFADDLRGREPFESSGMARLATKTVTEYFRVLEEHRYESSALMHSARSRLPSGLKSMIVELSDAFHLALTDFAREEYIGTPARVLDFVRLQSVAHNITQIANSLQEEYEKGFSVSNVWRIVDRLARQRLIETVGGRRAGRRDRFCFANIATLESRRIRNSKEEIVDGTVSTNLVPYLDFSRTFTFGIEVYEFNSDIIPRIYVISPHSLEIGLHVKTIGTFFEGGLEDQLKERYQIGFKDEDCREEYGEEDALVAYVHMKGEEIIWYDKENSRARVFT